MSEQSSHTDSPPPTKDELKKFINIRNGTRRKIRSIKFELIKIQAALFSLRVQEHRLKNRYARWNFPRAVITVSQGWHKSMPVQIKKLKISESVEKILRRIRRKLGTKLGQINRKLGTLEKGITTRTGEETKKKEALGGAQRKLGEERQIVISYAARLNRHVALAPLEQIRNLGARCYEKLGFPGTMTAGYILSVLMGLFYDFAFYRQYEINIFYYAQPEDFFLSGYKLLIFPFAIIFLWLLLYKAVPAVLAFLVAGLKLPVYTETVALIFPGLMKYLPVNTIFFILLGVFITGGPATAGWARGEHVDTEGKVSVLVDGPLGYVGNLEWVNSNSTYAFFKENVVQPDSSPVPAEKKSNLMIVPLSRITCIIEYTNDRSNDNFCDPKTERSNLTGEPTVKVELNPKNNLWIDQLIQNVHDLASIHPVTERELYAHIEDEMNCGGDKLLLYEFLLFNKGEHELRDRARRQIDYFRAKKGSIESVKVHGFASADGGLAHNQDLASNRACTVAGYMCNGRGTNNNNVDCAGFADPAGMSCNEMNIQVIGSHGEDHFINGVANSRSAVIAACE